MSRVILLGIVILLGAVFLVVPESNNAPTFAMFPLKPDATIAIQFYVHFVFEYLGWIALSFIVASEARTFKLSCKTFFWLQVADFVDYLLTYNSVWFHLGLLPISMNLAKVLVFGVVVFYEYNTEQ